MGSDPTSNVRLVGRFVDWNFTIRVRLTTVSTFSISSTHSASHPYLQKHTNHQPPSHLRTSFNSHDLSLPKSLTPRARNAKQVNTSFYVDYVSRDLRQIVECVVPVGRQGLPNLTSTKQVQLIILFGYSHTHDNFQILENWRTKRIIEPQRVDEVMQVLSSRQTQAAETSAASTSAPTSRPPSSRGPGSRDDAHLSRGEIFKRIEEDRERHKRLRERRWVQAQPQVLSHAHSSHQSHSHSPAAPGSGSGSVGYTAYALASFLPLSESENAELALDIEFENEWEATSDWNEDDVEAVIEERELCYPHLRRRGEGDGEELAEGEGGEEPMDLS